MSIMTDNYSEHNIPLPVTKSEKPSVSILLDLFSLAKHRNRPIDPKEAQIQANRTLLEEFRTPGLQTSLQLDLDEFKEKINRVKKLFSKVSNALKEHDEEPVRVSSPLQPQWEELFQRFREYIWASKDIATEIASSCDDFALVALPWAQKLKELKELPSADELDPFLKRLKDQIEYISERKENAHKLADNFEDLQRDISSFKFDLRRFWWSGKTATEQRKQLEQLDQIDATLEELLRDLDRFKKENTLSGVDAQEVLNSEYIAALFPRLLMRLQSVLSPSVHVRSLNRKQRKINAARGKKEGLISKLTVQQQSLWNIEQDMDEITNGLESFKVIWSAVNSDCKSIMIHFEKSQTTDCPTSLLISMRLGGTFYSCMAEMMRQYASGVDSTK